MLRLAASGRGERRVDLEDRHGLRKARGLLAPIYGRFTEAFDTRNLQKVRGLLAQLS